MVKVVKVAKISFKTIILTYKSIKKIIVDKTKIKALRVTHKNQKKEQNQKTTKAIYHFLYVVNYLVNVVNDKKENLNERTLHADRLCKKA